jgi:hypothetical protein
MKNYITIPYIADTVIVIVDGREVGICKEGEESNLIAALQK